MSAEPTAPNLPEAAADDSRDPASPIAGSNRSTPLSPLNGYYSASASSNIPIQTSSVRGTYYSEHQPDANVASYNANRLGVDDTSTDNGETSTASQITSTLASSAPGRPADLQSSTHQSLERLRRILQHNTTLPRIFYREQYSESGGDSTQSSSRNQAQSTASYGSSHANGTSGNMNPMLLDNRRDVNIVTGPSELSTMPANSNPETRLLIPPPTMSSSSLLSLGQPSSTYPYTRSPLRRSNTIHRRANPYLENAAKRQRKDESLCPSMSEKPMQLDLKMVYCDGGWHGDDYLPGNVLSLTNSVYCTQKPKCNMILRHKSDKPFTLHSITIKAPTTGFTCPVQQGLIFVSMNKDDMLPRTKYHDQQIDNMALSMPASMTAEYSAMRLPQSSQFGSTRSGEHPPSSFESLLEDYWSHPNFMGPPQPATLTDDDEGYEVEHYDGDDDQGVDYGSTSDNALDSFVGGGSPAPSHYSSLRPSRYYRGPLADFRARSRYNFLGTRPLHGLGSRFFRNQNGQSREVRIVNTDNITPPPDVMSNDGAVNPTPTISSSWSTRAAANGAESNIIDTDGKDSDDRATTSLPHTDSLILEPVAKFKIPDNRSKCTITFDSPLSAKYVYIKFYSSDPARNIDIQGVYINGFIGPRCFPTMSLR
ncbi:hypothetical protein V1525DRAFT_399799 [Lipomyces kononenkoae]|uniref:Uncharacterized protein n=1 Tax=Lipomyces kononenkoae TaxID=34357 RepID=A0ACC3T4S3_LIPKO